MNNTEIVSQPQSSETVRQPHSNEAVSQPQNNLVRSLVTKAQNLDPKTLLSLSGIVGLTILSGLAIVCFSGSSLSMCNGFLVVGRGALEKA